MSALTVPEVLRRAEAVIAERGWCQWKLSDTDGRVCGRGAINVAVSESPDGFDLYAKSQRWDLIDEAFATVSAHVGDYLSVWNDVPGRTEAEVRAALLAAAERAEAQS